jgi:hypothetical protein
MRVATKWRQMHRFGLSGVLGSEKKRGPFATVKFGSTVVPIYESRLHGGVLSAGFERLKPLRKQVSSGA